MARSIKHWPARLPRTAFLVDDHPVFCEGLAQVINAEKDLRVRGSAGTVAKALTGIARLQPDIVLVDISLPDRSGLELIKELRARDRKVKLLVVSMHDEALYADRVLDLGADGYIMKLEDPAEIVQAMRDVLDGHIYLSEEVLAGRSKDHPQRRSSPAAQPTRPLAELTDHDLEILELLGQSHSEEEIAEELGVGVPAICAASAEIGRKLNLKSHNALVRYAVCWVETGAR